MVRITHCFSAGNICICGDSVTKFLIHDEYFDDSKGGPFSSDSLDDDVVPDEARPPHGLTEGLSEHSRQMSSRS